MFWKKSPRILRTVTGRLTLCYAALFAILSLIVFFYVYHDLRVRLGERLDAYMENEVRELDSFYRAILYTDYVVAKLIERLQAQEYSTAMLYVSDHGESLGESGLYLHGLPYAIAPEEQKRVPKVFWASESFYREHGLDAGNLETSRRASVNHDYVFHTVLGLFGIETTTYQPSLDLLTS